MASYQYYIERLAEEHPQIAEILNCMVDDICKLQDRVEELESKQGVIEKDAYKRGYDDGVDDCRE